MKFLHHLLSFMLCLALSLTVSYGKTVVKEKSGIVKIECKHFSSVNVDAVVDLKVEKLFILHAEARQFYGETAVKYSWPKNIVISIPAGSMHSLHKVGKTNSKPLSSTRYLLTCRSNC